VKFVGSSEVRQLTTDPAFDAAPSWSPDGRQIAFLRFPPGGDEGRIYLMSALGGSNSKLSDFPTDDQIAWSPDGRVIAAARVVRPGSNDSTGIYVIPVDGGEPRAVTSTKSPAADLSPAFSPDGSRLAYVSCTEHGPDCDLYTVSLNFRIRSSRFSQSFDQSLLSRVASAGVATGDPSSMPGKRPRGSSTYSASL
jgi:Tol biopolymer transport system component